MNRRLVRVVLVCLAVLGFPCRSPAPLVFRPGENWTYERPSDMEAAQVELDSSEPSYGGKTINAWLDEYGAGPGGYKPSPQADEALRHIGANVAPYLLLLLQSTNPPAKAQAMNATPPPASWDHWKAFLGFQTLGPLGKAALPELVKLAHKPDGTGRYSNLQGMKNMTLVAALAHNSSTYVAADDNRWNWGGLQRNTEPFLVDGDIAAWSLAAIGADSVPALTELLADSNSNLRVRAVLAACRTLGEDFLK
jgi:hypothetical protein